MTPLDLGTRRVQGGFFLLKERTKAQAFAWQPDTPGDYRVLGTYSGSGAPIRDALLDMLGKAKRRVFVASFVIGDDAIIDALSRTAARLRGGVYVISALDERSLRRGMQEYEESEQVAPEERRKNFERLTSSGIYVRGHESCHAKFAVVDDTLALVGSANFVTAGFERTGEANLILRNPGQVRQLAKLFTELWYQGCKWEIPPGPNYLVADRAPSPPPAKPDPPSAQTDGLVWTNGAEHVSLGDAIRSTIDVAQEEVTLASYSIIGMREKPQLLFDSIRRAINRGVKVRLFLRQRNAWPEQMMDVMAAHDMGVSIHADLQNHAKVVVADSSCAVVFSANFDAKHGLDSGVEVGAHIFHTSTVVEIRRYIDHAISWASTNFVRDPLLAELDSAPLAARWCQPWDLGRELTVSSTPSDSERFAHAANSGPVLYELFEDSFRLYVGQVVLKCDLVQGQVNGTLFEAERGVTASDRLFQWMRSVRDGRHEEDQPVRRGFCPALLRFADKP